MVCTLIMLFSIIYHTESSYWQYIKGECKLFQFLWRINFSTSIHYNNAVNDKLSFISCKKNQLPPLWNFDLYFTLNSNLLSIKALLIYPQDYLYQWMDKQSETYMHWSHVMKSSITLNHRAHSRMVHANDHAEKKTLSVLLCAGLLKHKHHK